MCALESLCLCVCVCMCVCERTGAHVCEIIEKAMSSDSEIMSISCGGGGGEWEGGVVITLYVIIPEVGSPMGVRSAPFMGRAKPKLRVSDLQ